MKNAAWPLKRHELLKHSALTLNRELPDDWDAYRIRERSGRLAALAVGLWPRPDVDDEAAVRAAVGSAPMAAREADDDAVTSRSSGGRRDIAAHIQNAMRTVDVGDFLTIAEISRIPSEEYPHGSPPSQGAISARLFPGSGAPTTVPGVRAEIVGGRRGATRL